MKSLLQPPTTVNTLFNRVTIINQSKLTKQQAVQLGQLVKNKYLEVYKELPKKIAITIPSKTATVMIRTVAVYPDEFVNTMDVIIKHYMTEQRKALGFYKSKQNGK